jgi:large subunit ribosomal protein L25
MSNDHNLTATSRKDEGKGASRRLRRTGQVPAIVYGAHKDPQSIQLEHNSVFLASAREWFYSGIIDLSVDGAVQKVLLRDLQRHPFRPQILHLDFQRVSENEALHTRVPLHFLNQDTSPAGKISGVVITHERNEVEISCLPKHLPEFIEVDLSALTEGDVIHLSQIKLPEGVSIPELKLGKEHDIAIVIARQQRGGSDAEEAAAEGEGEDAKK